MKTEKENLKDLIDKGLKNKEIAEVLNLNISSVKRKLHDYKITRFTKKHTIIEDSTKQVMIDLYNSGLTCFEISDKLLIHRTTISRILKKAGIEIEKRITEAKLKLQEERGNRVCLICEGDTGVKRKICMKCYTNTRRFKIKKWMIEYKGGECIECHNSNLDIGCYDFHHLDPKEKDFNLSGLNSAKMSLEKVRKELDKCVLLCANCHREKHSNYKDIKFLNYISTLKMNFLK